MEETNVNEKILIVDDDDGVRQVLGESLQDAGHRVSSAESGEKAIATVREEAFDLVILDMVLPRVDGMAVLKDIATLRPELPVIMITARAEPGIEEKAMSSGASCFLRKPFDAETLVSCLQRVLRGV